MRPLRLTLLTLLVCGLAGCSRSQRFGTAIFSPRTSPKPCPSSQRFRKVVGVVIPIYLAATGLGRFRKEEPFPFGLRYRPAVVSCTMI